ncbi:hypothetical protein EBT16_02290 [bacterium]|nr:hypothetical protein [bacterium]
MEQDRAKIISEIPPLDAKGNFKRKFEVKMRPLGPNPQQDGVEKAVFIDGKKLDFKIDVLRFLEAKQKGINFLIEEQRKIEREFIKSVSEALGRKVTTEEIKRATLEGWI